MAHQPTNVFFRNRETGWCSHATVEISDMAEFKRKHRAVDLPVVVREAGVAKRLCMFYFREFWGVMV